MHVDSCTFFVSIVTMISSRDIGIGLIYDSIRLVTLSPQSPGSDGISNSYGLSWGAPRFLKKLKRTESYQIVRLCSCSITQFIHFVRGVSGLLYGFLGDCVGHFNNGFIPPATHFWTE